MKKILAFVAVAVLSFSLSAYADEEKPITKIMKARLGWIQSITNNIAYSRFDAVSTDAAALAAQTKKVGEASAAAFGKEKNLAISALAMSMAEAANNKDGAAVAAKFGETLGTCFSCHTKLRDK